MKAKWGNVQSCDLGETNENLFFYDAVLCLIQTTVNMPQEINVKPNL